MSRRSAGGYLTLGTLALGAATIACLVIGTSQSFHHCIEYAKSREPYNNTFSSITLIRHSFSRDRLIIACGAHFLEVHNGLITAFATVVVAWFTYTLWKTNGDLIDITNRSLVDIQRAFVSIDGFNTELAVLSDQEKPDLSILQNSIIKKASLYITRLAVQPRWKNSGGTPTEDLEIRVNWCGPAERIPPYYRLPDVGKQFFIGPGAVEPGEFVELQGGNSIVIHGMTEIDPEPIVCIWGRADYRDVFGKAHFREWCYRVRLERHKRKDQPMRATLIQYGDFNRSD